MLARAGTAKLLMMCETCQLRTQFSTNNAGSWPVSG